MFLYTIQGEELFVWDHDVLIVTKETMLDKKGEPLLEQYKLCIETYVGFDSIAQAAGAYHRYLEQLLNYLNASHSPAPGRRFTKEELIFNNPGICIWTQGDLYLIDLQPYTSDKVWELAYHLEDVIEHLQGVSVVQPQV